MHDPLLYVAVSYHGFGHIAQTAPVVNELVRRRPALRILIQCAAPREVLARHFDGDFEQVAIAPDIGMVMANSLDVRARESYASYTAFHRDWKAQIEQMTQTLRSLAPRLVFANIPYLPIAAAARAGVPAVALCSLNWADCFLPYCSEMPESQRLYRQMLDAYAQAHYFLVPTPHMPMPGLHNLKGVGPIARLGRNRRKEINERLGLDAAHRLVLLFLGGVFTELPVAEWPSLPDVNVVVSSSNVVLRDRLFALETTGFPYIDLVASADAVITKPGYGAFAEAACNGVPVLYTRRQDWPEEPPLIRWLREHACCRELQRERLWKGQFLPDLEALWRQPRRPAVAPTGAAVAADVIERLMFDSR
jgi:UDP:flavonoid glycosyltransferase YjiC (YdhE family)